MVKFILKTLVFPFLFFHSQAQNITILVNKGHNGPISIAASDPHNKLLATVGSFDHQVILWDVKEFLQIKSWNFESTVFSICFSADKSMLACGTLDGFSIINTSTFEVKNFNVKGWTTKLCFSPDNKYLLINSGYSDSISIWNIENFEKIISLKDHNGRITDFCFTSDGKWLFTSAYDNKLLVYDNKFKLKFILPEHNAYASCLSISSDNKWLGVGYANGSIHSFDISTLDNEKGEKIPYYEYNEHTKGITHITFFSGGYGFVSAGWDRVYKVWGTKPNAISTSSNLIWPPRYLGLNASNTVINLVLESSIQFRTILGDKVIHYIDQNVARPISVMFDASHSSIYCGYNDKRLRSIDLTNLSVNEVIKHGQMVNKSIVSSNGKYFASLLSDKSIVVYDKNGSIVHTLKTVNENAKAIAFSMDCNYFYFVDTLYFITKIDLSNGSTIWKKSINGKYNFTYPIIIKESWNGQFIALAENSSKYFILLNSQNGTIKNNTYLNTSQIENKIQDFEISHDNRFVYILLKGSANVLKFDVTNFSYKPLPKLVTNNAAVSCISSNDSMLIIGDESGNLIFYSLLQNRIVDSVHAHSGQINDLDVSADNRLLISAGNDGELKIWSMESYKNKATCLTFMSTNNFLFLTPDNYYTCSKEILNHVGYLSNGEVQSFMAYDFLFNRPDKIIEDLNCADNETKLLFKQAYLKRVKNYSVIKFANKTDSLPVIKIVNTDEIEKLFNPTEVDLEVAVKDNYSKKVTLHVFLNNTAIFGKKGITINIRNKKGVKKIKLPTIYGENRFVIYVVNSENYQSAISSINLNYVEIFPKKRNIYLISIGISRYADSSMNLRYAAKDANDFSSVIFEQMSQFYNVKKINLINEEVTVAKFISLRKELEKSQANDMVILFYAGHGVISTTNDYFLSTYNMDFSNPSVNGINYTLINDLLDGIPALIRTVFIDACYSGMIDQDDNNVISLDTTKNSGVSYRGVRFINDKKSSLSKKNSFNLMNELFTDVSRSTGAVVISSASGYDCAYESAEWQNGVFTYVLLNGLKSRLADLDNNGLIFTNEIQHYSYKEVYRLTNGRQKPSTRSNSIEFSNLLFKYLK